MFGLTLTVISSKSHLFWIVPVAFIVPHIIAIRAAEKMVIAQILESRLSTSPPSLHHPLTPEHEQALQFLRSHPAAEPESPGEEQILADLVEWGYARNERGVFFVEPPDAGPPSA